MSAGVSVCRYDDLGQPEHLRFDQPMDSVQDEAPSAAQDDLQRVGEIGVRDAVGVFWVCCWMSEGFSRGHLEPDAVVAPPREIEVPTKLFELEPAAREVKRSEPLALPVDRQQPHPATGPLVKLLGMTPPRPSRDPSQRLPERRLGLSGRVLDVTEHADERQLRDLLAPSIGSPTPQKVAAVARRYRNDHDWTLYGWEDESGALTGCIGLERRSIRDANVRHLAVAPGARRQGVGSALIAAAIESTSVERLLAATDEYAVGFYERCGFRIAETTSRWDRQRFLCTLDLSPPQP